MRRQKCQAGRAASLHFTECCEKSKRSFCLDIIRFSELDYLCTWQSGHVGNRMSAHADLAPTVQLQHPIGCRTLGAPSHLEAAGPCFTAAVPTLQSPSHDSEFPYF